MKKYLFIAIIVLAASLFAALRWGNVQRAERIRLDRNQTALMGELEHYVTKDGKNVVSIGILTLQVGEYERLRAADAAQIRDLGIKIKRLESVSKTGTETRVEIKAPIVETPVIGRDSLPATVRSFEWSDPWVSVAGTIDQDSVSCSVISRDTLLQVIHRVPRKFLFFRWGTKAIRQEIVPSNPHTTIIYNETIKLER